MSVPIYIYPPKELANRDIVDFFKNQEWPTRKANEIIFDFRNLEFVAPWAVCLYGAYAHWMRQEHQCTIRIKGTPTTRAGAYIARSGLPYLVGSDFSAPDTMADVKTIKLSSITKSADIYPLVEKILRLLDIDDEEMEGATKYSIVELVRNAVQHSQSITGGMVMAQFYPKPGEVDVIVADMGEGIRATLGANGNIESDTQALNKAVRSHVSGTFKPKAYGSMEDNAGLGLFITSEIAAMSDGVFTLGSGDALLQIKGDERGDRKNKLHRAGKEGWPGTFAILQLRRDSIGAFDDLLETCLKATEKIRMNPLEFSLTFLDNIPEGDDTLIIRVSEFEENVEYAAKKREESIAPALKRGELVVLDFSNIQFATQSFAHALFYKLFRDIEKSTSCLLLANCTKATQKAIKLVAGYAKSGELDK